MRRAIRGMSGRSSDILAPARLGSATRPGRQRTRWGQAQIRAFTPAEFTWVKASVFAEHAREPGR